MGEIVVPAKFDRCVRKVKASLRRSRRAGNAYAICGAALRHNPVEMKPSLEGVHLGWLLGILGVSAAGIAAIALFSPRAEASPGAPPQPPEPIKSNPRGTNFVRGSGDPYVRYRDVFGKNPSGVWQELAAGWDPGDDLSDADAPMLHAKFNWPIFEWVFDEASGTWTHRQIG